jgi:outer membrane protein TolC
MSKHPMIFFWIVIISFTQAKAQQDSLPTEATLDQCVRYALQHQPAINQSYIDEKIVNAEIKSRIADWYPQIGFDYTLQHYFKTPVSIINGNPVATAQKNFSTAFFSVTQNIFNADALLASKSAGKVRTQAKQYIENNKIYVTLNVSKAFYDVLLSQQQLVLVDQDIAALARSVKDSYNQYVAGVADKTDYKRAQISLNNSYADKKRYEEQLTAKASVLKLLMGYPQDSVFI